MTFSFLSHEKCLIFDEMPVWRGMQARPGVYQTKPFQLFEEKTGLLVQNMSKELANEVIGRYSREDYTFITAPPGTTQWAKANALKKLNWLEQQIQGSSPEMVLEIGSGNTWFAEAFCENFSPRKYICVDPALPSFDQGVIQTISDYFPSSKTPDHCFDLIIAFNVLEHVAEPDKVLFEISERLNPSGIAILTVPDCERQLREGDINCFIHEHITYYTGSTLYAALKKCGFDVLKINSRNDLFTVLIKKKGISEGEIAKVFESPIGIATVAESLNFLFDDMATSLAEALASGAKVAFHGATQGLNTFLHLTDLGKADVSIFDGDETKAGLYLPACQKPVAHYLEEGYSKHDIIVVSAMSFCDAITRDAGERGIQPEQIWEMNFSTFPAIK